MQVVIYGLGTGRRYVESNLRPQHNIVGYTDSFSRIRSFANKPFYNKDELQNVTFDYIILAIQNKEVCKQIKRDLEINQGIPSNKIVEYWKIYYYTLSYNLVDHRMKNVGECLDGLILGISHAEVGINVNYMSGNWCNLAISSQDLFGSYKVLEYAYDKYKSRFSSLKYVILDMWDYLYFNYDVSMARNALNYIGNVPNILGIWHNYENKDSVLLEKTYLFSHDKNLNDEELNQMNMLFQDIHKSEYVDEVYLQQENHNFIEKDDDNYLKPDYMPQIAKKHFDSTIEENIEIFKKLLKQIYEIDKSIKVFCILIPRYQTIENIHDKLYLEWKKEYEEIMYEMRKNYSFEMLNYKHYASISSNNRFYYDAAHLNATGAIAFTSVLNEDVQKY